eukprot:COSAG06_NODE_19125_length_852_cov_1.436919_1_plen_257_part_10
MLLYARLRWNSTACANFFVHVSTLDEAAVGNDYTMAVVVPQLYSWESVVNYWVLNPFGSAADSRGTLLTIGMNEAIPVDLPFSFPYFGRTYTQAYVSSSGFISFVRPLASGFVGIDMLHTAIVAALAEWSMHAPGAEMRYRAADSELQVVWHAPLFNSHSFSDVAVTLRSNGSIAFAWNQLDASKAHGSIDGGGLAVHLPLDSPPGVDGFSDSSIHGRSGIVRIGEAGGSSFVAPAIQPVEVQCAFTNGLAFGGSFF